MSQSPYWKFTDRKQPMNMSPGTRVSSGMPNQNSPYSQGQNNSNNQIVQMDPNQIGMQQIQDMPNPFNNPAFSNNLPDLPIADQGAAMLNALLSDETVPTDIRKRFWFVFHRDNTLTFLDPERKASKLLSFDILKIDFLNNLPYYDYTFEAESEWTAARQMFETKLDRSLGNKKGQNERLVIPMTVNETISRVEDNSNTGQKEGFLKRILQRK